MYIKKNKTVIYCVVQQLYIIFYNKCKNLNVHTTINHSFFVTTSFSKICFNYTLRNLNQV